MWKVKQDVSILTNVYKPPEEGSFRDTCRRYRKPAIAKDYSQHMGYVNKGDRTANNYSVSQRT
jgi:hypothetical protein